MFNGFFKGMVWRDTDDCIVLGSFSRANPVIPSGNSGGAKLFSRKRAGRTMAAQIDDTGLIYPFQPQLGSRHIAQMAALGGTSTSIAVLGVAFNVTGTATGVAYAPSTKLGAFKRIQYVSNTVAASQAGLAGTRALCRGSAAGCGGFWTRFRFSIDSIDAAHAVFVGLWNAASDMGDVDPSSGTDICGFGADAADANMQWMVNDNAGSATKVNLGANFPAKTIGAIYEATIFCKPNDTVLYYALRRIDSDFIIEGSSSADLPRNTYNMSPQFHVGTRAVAGTAATIGVQNYVSESEL